MRAPGLGCGGKDGPPPAYSPLPGIAAGGTGLLFRGSPASIGPLTQHSQDATPARQRLPGLSQRSLTFGITGALGGGSARSSGFLSCSFRACGICPRLQQRLDYRQAPGGLPTQEHLVLCILGIGIGARLQASRYPLRRRLPEIGLRVPSAPAGCRASRTVESLQSRLRQAPSRPHPARSPGLGNPRPGPSKTEAAVLQQAIADGDWDTVAHNRGLDADCSSTRRTFLMAASMPPWRSRGLPIGISATAGLPVNGAATELSCWLGCRNSPTIGPYHPGAQGQASAVLCFPSRVPTQR